MRNLWRKEKIRLFIGDLSVLVISLWIALYIRNFEFPGPEALNEHIKAFSILIVIWFIVFYIAGLYDNHISFVKNKISKAIILAQFSNVWISIAFFYFIAPYLNIAPKTNLFIYIFISTVFLIVWRNVIENRISEKTQSKAILLANSSESEELFNEINNNKRFPFYFANKVQIDNIEESAKSIEKQVSDENIEHIIFDQNNQKVIELLPHLYDLLFSRVEFIEVSRLYEDSFRRIPLSAINQVWFLKNISFNSHTSYDIVKRLMDIAISAFLAIFYFLSLPFVYLLIKLDDRGPIFIHQTRVGHLGKNMDIIKYRTMSKPQSDKGIWLPNNDNKVTRVGHFLRKSRIDELPQIWSVIKGDLSLIGPRPDIEALGDELLGSIPYYATRYTIKPGLSGWAQVMQGLPPQSIEETKVRLAYDLYYIKNRSLWLDFLIALRTIKTLSSRLGM